MRYRKRGSHKGADTIQAIQFMGFTVLPIDARRNKPVVPDWLPPIDLEVYDELGTFDTAEIDPTPAGKVWRMGDKFARFGIHDGHIDCKIGDFIVRYPDGTVLPMAREVLHANYRGV